MKICGIDTGLKGAIAVIDEIKSWSLDSGMSSENRVSVLDTPIMATGKGKNEYDIPAMRDLLIEINPTIVFLERSQPMPGQGVVSMWSTGLGFGIWKGLIIGLKLPLQVVHTRTWQKALFEGFRGDTKDISYQIASSLFPGVANDLKGPKGGLKDGRCDALLIAEYGRRIYKGDSK